MTTVTKNEIALRPDDFVGGPEDLHQVKIHGHKVCFRLTGSGPLIVLIHGITGSSDQWIPVMDVLRDRYTLFAPDLLGHGESAKPRGDYSLGAYASGVRDLLLALGHDRATVVGHSLGGGVAMQFGYQFPERLDRIVLVSSGGLGREVNILLRSAALPGAELVLPLLVAPALRDATAAVAGFLGRFGLRPSYDLEEMARGFASLGDLQTRQAFIHTVRGIIGWDGQRVSAMDRLYLAADIPTMLVWGERDPMIPADHGVQAHEVVSGSRLEIFPGAGHFPHRHAPERFTEVLLEFIAETEAAELDHTRVRELIQARTA